MHDDCFHLPDQDAAELFYIQSSLQAITVDNKICSVNCHATLIDSGSKGNLITEYIVEALRAKKVPTEVSCTVASGDTMVMRAIEWILLLVSGANQIIAATVVPSNPGYLVLLLLIELKKCPSSTLATVLILTLKMQMRNSVRSSERLLNKIKRAPTKLTPKPLWRETRSAWWNTLWPVKLRKLTSALQGFRALRLSWTSMRCLIAPLLETKPIS